MHALHIFAVLLASYMEKHYMEALARMLQLLKQLHAGVMHR
jgi:uncharacterized membrane protein YebE (DUF533 family)